MKANLLSITVTLLFFSCAVKMPTERRITEEKALEIIKQEVGTVAPAQSIFHSYQQISSETYTGSTRHICNKSKVLNIVEDMSFSKIDGNYIEGAMIYRDDCEVRHYTFKGRFDEHRLLLTRDSGGISEYIIEQNGRLLRENRVTGYETLAGEPKWYNIPQNGEQPYSSSKSVYKTTYFLSTSDNVLGKSKEGNNNTSSTLTGKLKELKDLYESEVISKEEYEAARKKAIENQ